MTGLLQASPRPVHLVGHSYGGAVALRAALERPDAVASLTLYEPSAFSLLRHMGGGAAAARREIESLAARIEGLVRSARPDVAMQVFTDYWQGPGSWSALSPDLRRTFAALAGRIPHDFAALFTDPLQPQDLGRLAMRCLIVAGDRSPLPARLVAHHVALAMPQAHLIELPGVGHMGPVTHRARVAALIARHVGIPALAAAAA